MKRVLIVTYYFPPSGGPGVQRVLKFSQYLPEFGWKPYILTVKDGDYPARDESLLKEIPEQAVVYRTNIREPYDVYRRFTGKKKGTPVDVNTIPKPGERRSLRERFAEFVRATLFIPDARIGWLKPAVQEGLNIIREQHIDALYSSSPPYTCALIARALKRKTGLPWIAGFRDPWTGFLSTPTRWFLPAMIDRRLERSVFAECDRLDVAWKGILKDFHSKYPDIPLDKAHHLPNGFDSSDFPSVEIIDPEHFTITYTGSMYGKRNPESFLNAVASLVQRGLLSVQDIRLQFIGRFGAEVHAMFNHPVLRDCIIVKDYMPHSDSVRHLFQSDALLMIVDDFEGNEEIVPGKVYEYIGSGKPVITLAPEGAVTSVIEETRSGRCTRSHDVESIANIVLDFYTRHTAGTLGLDQRRDIVRRFERREVTRSLATLLDDISST